MYWAGEYLGFTTADHLLKESTIPAEDISNPDLTKSTLDRLKNLTNFDHSLRPSTDFNMTDFFDRVGIQFNDLIYDCKYRGKACRQSDFKVTFTEYGKCYTFNQPNDLTQLKQTLKGGLDNGLEIILNAQQEDHLPIFRETENINFESGIKIHIHDPIEPNFIKV